MSTDRKQSLADLRKELALTRQRECALRVVMDIFNVITDDILLQEVVNMWDQTSHATTIEEVNSILKQLEDFARQHQIHIPYCPP